MIHAQTVILYCRSRAVCARLASKDFSEMRAMGGWLSAEINTVLIGSVLAIITAGVPMVVAWFRVQTKKLNLQAEENRAILEENTKLTQQIQKQTDGLTKKMTEIASVVGFRKGQSQGREEGSGNKPYEALTNLEDEIAKIMQKDYTRSGPRR